MTWQGKAWISWVQGSLGTDHSVLLSKSDSLVTGSRPTSQVSTLSSQAARAQPQTPFVDSCSASHQELPPLPTLTNRHRCVQGLWSRQEGKNLCSRGRPSPHRVPAKKTFTPHLHHMVATTQVIWFQARRETALKQHPHHHQQDDTEHKYLHKEPRNA